MKDDQAGFGRLSKSSRSSANSKGGISGMDEICEWGADSTKHSAAAAAMKWLLRLCGRITQGYHHLCLTSSLPCACCCSRLLACGAGKGYQPFPRLGMGSGSQASPGHRRMLALCWLGSVH